MRILKHLIVFMSGILFITDLCHGQDQKIADSLVLIYHQKTLDDSSKLEILGDIAFNNSDLGQRLYYAGELIELARKKENNLYIFRGYYYKGQALRLKGEPDKAVEAFFEGAGFAQKAKYKRGIGVSYVAIGDVYRLSHDHKNATLYLNKAIGILRQVNDSITLASALLNTGNEYLILDRNDTALNLFRESSEIFARFRYQSGVAYCLGNIGKIYSNYGNYSLAEKKLLEAIQILKKLKDSYAYTSFELNLSVTYQKQGNTDLAIRYAKSSYSEAMKNGLTAQVRDACLQLSSIYQEIKDYRKAYFYQSEFFAYRDSINNIESVRKMADLRTEFEVAQKQSEVDQLVRKRNINRIIAGGLALVVILSVTLLMVLYRGYRRKQSLNALLVEQKEELMTQQEQLETLNRTKDRFFSIISHDLRGPIGAIGSFPILFKEYIEMNNTEELSELVTHMDRSVQHVSSLLDNLLDWALSQQGTFPFHPENVQLNMVLDDISSVFLTMAQNKSIHLTWDVDEHLWAFADKNSLMTIVRNLLNNAIKFTPKGGAIALSAYAQNGSAVIVVKDNGIGIKKEKLQNLFVLNEKKSTWGTDNEKGLGLGLSLVYEFVKMNRGSLRVDSQVGVGTSFFVSIPRSEK